MKGILLPALILSLTLSTAAQAQTTPRIGTKPVELGLTAGYASGLSGEVFVHVPNVAGPIGVKASAAYTLPGDNIRDNVDVAGNSGYTFADMKKNDGASESGSHLTFGVDGTYNVGEITPGISALLYAGGRYGMFKATETYPASGSTTYAMNAFGVGAGAQLSYALAGNMSLVADLGVDQYFNSAITASGNAKDTWQTSEAGYNDVRNRMAFPGAVFKAKVGVKLGGY